MDTDIPTTHEDYLRSILTDWAEPPPETLGKLPRKTKDGTIIHLSYMDHAQVTAALIRIDPFYTYEWVTADDGLPRIRQIGDTLAMGIRLTLGGVTRPGIGTAKTDAFDPLKELIGDALRNAAMRFGIALSLWSKAESLPTDSPLPPSHGSSGYSHAEPPSDPLDAHIERLKERANSLSPAGRGSLRASMALQELSFNQRHRAADIELLIHAAELAETEAGNGETDAV